MSSINSPRKYQLQDLLTLMSRLRTPETGCPWDLKQDFLSITPSTIEEAYEVVDAIEQGDQKQIKEELGDLLFQVVFYAQLAREEGFYDFNEIVDTLTDKLIRRHPHVFPDGTLESVNKDPSSNEEVVKTSWEQIKKQERSDKGKSGLLDDVPLNLPALSRAQKLQKRAASVGFDWPDISGPLAKISEETEELKQAIESGDKHAQEAELGDLIFSVVNLARKLKLDSEACLRRSNNVFRQRINYIESNLKQKGSQFDKESLETLDQLWNEAKEALASEEEQC